MKRIVRIVLSALVLAAIGIQFVPVSRTNPPVPANFDGPPDVARILRAACYDCHSNETRWPWYSHIAPISWLAVSDAEEAREAMNFSEWGSLSADVQKHLREEIWKEVEEDDMPLLLYRLVHSEGRLSDEQKAVLFAWSGAGDEPGGPGGTK